LNTTFNLESRVRDTTNNDDTHEQVSNVGRRLLTRNSLIVKLYDRYDYMLPYDAKVLSFRIIELASF
jgi:hypothetical protein